MKVSRDRAEGAGGSNWMLKVKETMARGPGRPRGRQGQRPGNSGHP